MPERGSHTRDAAPPAARNGRGATVGVGGRGEQGFVLTPFALIALAVFALLLATVIVGTLRVGHLKLAQALAGATARASAVSGISSLQSNPALLQQGQGTRDTSVYNAVLAGSAVTGGLSSWLAPLVLRVPPLPGDIVEPPNALSVAQSPAGPAGACQCVTATVVAARAAGRFGQFVETATRSAVILTPPAPGDPPCATVCPATLVTEAGAGAPRAPSPTAFAQRTAASVPRPAGAMRAGRRVTDASGRVVDALGVLPVGVRIEAVTAGMADGATRLRLPVGGDGAALPILPQELAGEPERVAQAVRFLGFAPERVPDGEAPPGWRVGEAFAVIEPPADAGPDLWRLVRERLAGRTVVLPFVRDGAISHFATVQLVGYDGARRELEVELVPSAPYPLAEAGPEAFRDYVGTHDPPPLGVALHGGAGAAGGPR